MNTPNGGFLHRLSRLVRPLSLIIGSALVLAGLVLMATWSRSAVGALIGIGGFLVLLMFTILFVGTVYLLTRMSDDIRALRMKAESSGETTKSDGESKPPTVDA